MLGQLGLTLDTPQIEQLFAAVSGGGASVQFDDFIEAPSTRYYLSELLLPQRDAFATNAAVLDA